MVIINAIVRPSKLDALQAAMSGVGVRGITITEVSGFGRQKGHTEVYRGAEYHVDALPKLKVEIATEGDQLQACMDAMIQAVRTGQVGDGKIFVTPLEEVIRIRTGEIGQKAI